MTSKDASNPSSNPVNDDSAFFTDVIRRVATGPHLSKDLPHAEARRAMLHVLSGRADPVQAGIFLIALRMKRETDEELAGVLDAIQLNAVQGQADVDELTVLVDPYNGYNRCLPAAPFLPAVLAAVGMPTLSHGVAEMGPKFGATHEMILSACGIDVSLSVTSACSVIESADIGWCYLSQQQMAPALFALQPLRTQIVKRPCLTTVEVALQVVRARQKNHLLTGFVHKAYPPVYGQLAMHAGFASATLVRGVEGGVVPSLTQASRYFLQLPNQTATQHPLDPSALGIQQPERAVPIPDALLNGPQAQSAEQLPGNAFAPAVAMAAAHQGLSALRGEPGATRDSLVYAGAVAMLARARCDTLIDGADLIRQVLDDGSALSRFDCLRRD